MNIDISKAVKVSQAAPPVSERRRFLDRAGFILACILLFAIIVEMVIVGIQIGEPTSDILNLIKENPDLTKPENIDRLKVIADQMDKGRLAFLNLAKTILVNVLLPLLTAVLGYIFGSREGKES